MACLHGCSKLASTTWIPMYVVVLSTGLRHHQHSPVCSCGCAVWRAFVHVVVLVVHPVRDGCRICWTLHQPPRTGIWDPGAEKHSIGDADSLTVRCLLPAACCILHIACCMLSLDVDVVGDRACVQLPEFPGAAGEGCRRSQCAGRWPRDWQGGVWLVVLPTFRTVLWPRPCTAWLARVRLCMSRPSLPTRCGSCPGSRMQLVLAAPPVIKTWRRQSLQV